MGQCLSSSRAVEIEEKGAAPLKAATSVSPEDADSFVGVTAEVHGVRPPDLKPGDALPAHVFPYNTSQYADEPQRVAELRASRYMQEPAADTQALISITELMTTVFQVPISVITLIDEHRLALVSPAGRETLERRCGGYETACEWVLVPSRPIAHIVEDMGLDARYSGHQFVVSGPRFRFYAGAPLIGSRGFRYGTLCICDQRPRHFPADLYNVLINFADLVVCELERGRSADTMCTRADTLVPDAIALVDASDPDRWVIKYVNEPWVDLLSSNNGLSSAATTTTWSGSSRGDQPPVLAAKDWLDMVVQDKFIVDIDQQPCNKNNGTIMTHPRSRNPAAVSLTLKLPGDEHSGLSLRAVLRPAGTDRLLESNEVGITNFIKDVATDQAQRHDSAPSALSALRFLVIEAAQGHTLELVEVNEVGDTRRADEELSKREDKDAAATGGVDTPKEPKLKTNIAPTNTRQPPASLRPNLLHPPGSLASRLSLGMLLGAGSFGRVYHGVLDGDTAVAVKILPDTRGNALAEAQIGRSLDHPNVVRTLEYASGMTGDEPAVWIVQEYCGAGTLYEAVDRGWLRLGFDYFSGPDMDALLCTLRDIAAGLAQLHANNVTHGDLTGANVLLVPRDNAAQAMKNQQGKTTNGSESKDRRSFSAKLADFGMSRELTPGSIVENVTAYGTVSHMPPELLERGVLSLAADIYALGVLLYEMYEGQRAWRGLRAPQVLHRVLSLSQELRVVPVKPGDPRHVAVAELSRACLAREPRDRPSAEQVLQKVEELLAMPPKGQEVVSNVSSPVTTLPPCSVGARSALEAAQGTLHAELRWKAPPPIILSDTDPRFELSDVVGGML